MAAKGILPPTLKMILKKYYPLPCTEPESSRNDHIESYSLKAPADGLEEERLEIPLAVQPDDMTGKHRDREQIPLERAQLLREEGKVVPMRAFLALKSPSSAGKELEGP